MNYTETILQKLTEMELLAKKFQSPASSIDKELLKKKCIELYELILTENVAVSAEATSVLIPPYTPEVEVKVEAKIEERIEIKAEKEVETIDASEVLASAQTPFSAPEQQEVEEENTPTHTPLHSSTHTPSTQENFNKHTDEFLFEKIAKTTSGQPEFIQHLNAHAENLKTTITLNQKIAFVNDLFKENTVDYAKAIDNLNGAKDLNDALRIFGELKYSYEWNENDALVKELETLITKRFQG